MTATLLKFVVGAAAFATGHVLLSEPAPPQIIDLGLLFFVAGAVIVVDVIADTLRGSNGGL